MKHLFWLLPCFSLLCAAEPYARYSSDSGLRSENGAVTQWEAVDVKRSLSRVHGSPAVWRVRTADGSVREVLRLDGSSALWRDVGSWGRIEGPRSIVLCVRVAAKAEGVLFDGSTRSGAGAVRQKGGAQPKWEVLHFKMEEGGLGGFILGADVATRNGLACDVAELAVFDQKISDAELVQLKADWSAKWSGATDLPDAEQIQPWRPFAGLTTKMLRRHGEDGVHTYRIPGLATSVKGTLLAVFDLRHDGAGDLPGNIDVGLVRSVDDGETWSRTTRVIDYERSGVGDPCILVDRETSRIFVAALWSKGNRAWASSGPGLTPEETGQLVITHSDDDGLTWSEPRSITQQVKKPEWRLLFNGPGAGIQKKDGSLVMPAQFRDADGTPHSCFISSQDHGETWSISAPCTGRTSEAQIAEIGKGELLITMRDESRSGKRLWQRHDGTHWSVPWSDLPDPTCQASLLRHTDGSLLFSNPADSKARRALTVRTSRDDGKTWSEGRLIDPRGSMYSCLTSLRDGRIGLFYEGVGGLIFATFAAEGANLATLPEGRFETKGKFGWWPARHAQKRAESKKEVKVLFLGDSITQGWEKTGAEVWQQHIAPLGAANYGFGGDSTQHVLWRIDHGELDGMSPSVIVLLLGTNNAKHGDFTPQQIAEGLGSVLERLKKKCPQSRILLHALFPRDERPDGEMRRKCAEVNALLPALADGKQVRYLDFSAAFLTPDGILTREIAPDSLHLSALGYQRWAEALLPHLVIQE